MAVPVVQLLLVQLGVVAAEHDLALDRLQHVQQIGVVVLSLS